MIVEGAAISQKVEGRVKRLVQTLGSRKLRLLVVSFGSEDASRVYLMKKEEAAKRLGFGFVHAGLKSKTTKEAVADLSRIIKRLSPDGVIVQLPVARGLATQEILDAIPASIDPDMLSSESLGLFASGVAKTLPPVAAAIDEILKRHKVGIKGKNVVVVGAGALVGRPAAIYFQQKNATVTVCNKFTKKLSRFTSEADILISGTGVAGLITPKDVKSGAVVIDVGFSRVSGKLTGDVVPSVASKALVFSGVPGGVGSITVAKLFENIVRLKK